MTATNTRSRKRAIEQHCKDCIYDPDGGAGTWREQTQNCTATQCALWPFRPRAATARSNTGESLTRPRLSEIRRPGDHHTTDHSNARG
ncbi:MAG: hypothetical protein ACQETO_09120 [Pseudomonadota bacterium]